MQLLAKTLRTPHPLHLPHFFQTTFIKMLHTCARVIYISLKQKNTVSLQGKLSILSAQVEIALLTRGKISIRSNFFLLPWLSVPHPNVDPLS